ncbi:dnaJ homolog subfamily C member 17 isoform X2 [Pseudochaenichthys georgianus]|uniref:dnaJ homolog subfamily C member 17 isoform X2 n=1 Tax=Pseudochaenichthys georgianus TaxID=52239 RepID=UPI00146DA029|nr:dnaJ homolog subfamily C member 17 isoform X2 [Pseudochaenichthys georgianus]
MSKMAKDILKMDLYGLLGIDITATPKEIKKAYRQKALTCHPDKNPDNPKAVELFHQLSQALEVLTDAPAKAAYDKICAAKKQAEERHRKLDDKRKKIKLDLESREQQAEAQTQDEAFNTRTLEEEIARLREEGSRQLEEEQRLIREQIQRERETQQMGSYTISGVVKCSKTNVTPKLKYGDVSNVIVSSKKKGSAVVEFATVRAAELAAKNESGLSENPLKISWLEGQPEVIAPASQPGLFMSSQGQLSNERDYESVVMMKMRQAAERQKLIEQMQKEDDEEA